LAISSSFSSLSACRQTSPRTGSWTEDARILPSAGGYGPDAQQPVRQMALDLPPSVVHNFFGVTPAQARSAKSLASMQFVALDPGTQHVIDTCVQVWSASGPNGTFQNACNYFVVEVANRLGVTFSGRADDIVDQRLDRSCRWPRCAGRCQSGQSRDRGAKGLTSSSRATTATSR
jgi:hypothetical protein